MSLSPAEWEVISLSLKVAIWCVGVNLIPSLAMAWLLARCDFPGKSVVNATVHLPLVIPPVVTGYVLLVLLGKNGPIGSWLYSVFDITLIFTWKGAVIAAAVMSYPLMVRAMRTGIEALDPRLEEAAQMLGKSRLHIFRTISLPLILPAIISAMTLGFARALGEFGATITFVSNIPGETRTLPIAIYSLIQIPGGEDKILKLVLISVLISFAAIALSEYLVRRSPARTKES
ncbi:molybdate ABC transporter permease subunit [Sneathiella limimaris]|uniref:molybdate ABC transporter permease subunit n=1 Tax=Sneathiella limimaris TaxID=1964213 RepID=UPI00146E9FC9|nr:molybdate ABC transporter permease subunit [Sneathiella limimaris]